MPNRLIPRLGSTLPALEKVEITTQRLLLRPVSMSYAEMIFQEFTAEITRYMTPKTPSEISEVRQFIEESRAALALGTDLILAILRVCDTVRLQGATRSLSHGLLERRSEEFLGCCGLHARQDGTTPELGIWIKKSAHGSGYGREAIHGLVGWADRYVEYSYLIYPVDKANLSSRKIPESLGGAVFQERQVLSQGGYALDEVVYRIERLR